MILLLLKNSLPKGTKVDKLAFAWRQGLMNIELVLKLFRIVWC